MPGDQNLAEKYKSGDYNWGKCDIPPTLVLVAFRQGTCRGVLGFSLRDNVSSAQGLLFARLRCVRLELASWLGSFHRRGLLQLFGSHRKTLWESLEVRKAHTNRLIRAVERVSLFLVAPADWTAH
jgi:hypothetical protein